MKIFLCILTTLFAIHLEVSSQNLQVKQGTISFESNAELEIIKASSNKLKGLFNAANKNFAFTIEIASFEGFNSALQKEHFNENYMETATFPKASFSGKILDNFDPNKDKQIIRAKGKLDVHGVVKERILEIEFTKKNSEYIIFTNFNIRLEDHDITIPRIVHQKISPTIAVDVKGVLKMK
jgi:polyisoprenoid-binding protein YceI